MPARKKTVTLDDVKNLIRENDNARTAFLNANTAAIAPVVPSSASDVRQMQLDDYINLRARDITIEDAKVRAQFGANILGSICVESKMEMGLEV